MPHIRLKPSFATCGATLPALRRPRGSGFPLVWRSSRPLWRRSMGEARSGGKVQLTHRPRDLRGSKQSLHLLAVVFAMPTRCSSGKPRSLQIKAGWILFVLHVVLRGSYVPENCSVGGIFNRAGAMEKFCMLQLRDLRGSKQSFCPLLADCVMLIPLRSGKSRTHQL